MSLLQPGDPGNQKQNGQKSDNYTQRRLTPEAEAVLTIFRSCRKQGISVIHHRFWDARIEQPFEALRELRNEGFQVITRVEFLESFVELSYQLVFDPEIDDAGNRWTDAW